MAWQDVRSLQKSILRQKELLRTRDAVAFGLAKPADHADRLKLDASDEDEPNRLSRPFGAEIIRTAPRFDSLVHESGRPLRAKEAIDSLREEIEADRHPTVLHALEQVTRRRDEASAAGSARAPGPALA